MGGTHTYADGDVVTASVLNTYVRDQVISQVTSGTRPTGTAGQEIYETDTGRKMIYNGSAWLELGRTTGVQTWTPQVDQGATTNIGKTVVLARYVQVGNITFVWCTLTMTGAGTAGSSVTVTLPVAASGYNVNDPIGSGQVADSSAGANSAIVGVWINSSSTVCFQIDSTASAGRWGLNPNIALASGDAIRFEAQYVTA